MKSFLINTSNFTLHSLLNDSKNIRANFENYLDGFSPNIKDIIDKFKFKNELDTLDEKKFFLLSLSDFVVPKSIFQCIPC